MKRVAIVTALAALSTAPLCRASEQRHGLTRTGPVDEIIVVDLKFDKLAGGDAFQTDAEDILGACATIQGLVNRESREKIYLLNMPHRFYWNGFNGDLGNSTQQMLTLLPTPTVFAKLDRDKKYPALSYLLKNYAGVLKGKVLCDAIEKNIAKAGARALAITACGFEDALFCPPAVDAYLNEESIQLKTLVDTSGLNNKEAWAELLARYAKDPRRNKTLAAHYFFGAQDGPAMFDYWVANRVIAWFLHGKRGNEAQLVPQLLNSKVFPPGMLNVGGAETSGAIGAIQSAGYTFAYGEAANCSVTASISYAPRFKAAPAGKAYKVESSGVYIAWNGPDGDALDFAVDIMLKSFLNTPHAGVVPMGWRVNPHFMDLNPMVYDAYARTFENVELVSSMHDGGFPGTEAGREAYARSYAEYVKRSQGVIQGLHCFGPYRPGRDAFANVLRPHLAPSYIIRGYDGYMHDRWEYSVLGPTVSCSQVGISDNYTPEAGFRYFSGLIEHPRNQGKPLFMVARAGLKNGNHFFWWINKVSRRLTRESGRPVHFLRPADLIATLKAYKAGKAVSDAPPTIDFSTPPVPADRLRTVTKALDEAVTYLEKTEAIFALGRMGPGASSSVPRLKPFVSDKDRDVRISACWALGSIEDTRAVQPLTKALTSDQDDGVRWAAAKALGCFGADAASAVSALVEACEDPEHHEIRMWAMASLASIGGTLPPAKRRALVGEILRLTRGLGRRSVFPANALGSIGTEQDVPQIARLLDAENDDEIRAGAYALGLIGRPAAIAAPKLKTLLPSVSDKTQRTIRWALSRM